MLCGGAEDIIQPSTCVCLKRKSLVASSPRWLPFLQSGLRVKELLSSFEFLQSNCQKAKQMGRFKAALVTILGRVCSGLIQEVGSHGTAEAGA